MRIEWTRMIGMWRYATGLALAGLVVFGLVQFTRLPVFQVRQVDISGTQRVTSEQTRLVIADYVKGSLFDLNLDRIRAGFGKLPWVRAVDVRRVWPNRLVVRLEEHQPLARWNEDALLDTHGDVFMAATDMKLVRLAGPEGSNQQVRAEWQQFSRILSPLRRSVVNLTLDDRQSWQMVLDNGTRIELGRQDMDARLSRWVRLMPQMQAWLPQPLVRVDLRYPQGIAVEMAQQQAIVPDKQKEGKQS